MWYLHENDPLHELEGREPNTGINAWLINKSKDFGFANGQNVPSSRDIPVGASVGSVRRVTRRSSERAIQQTEEEGIDSS